MGLEPRVGLERGLAKTVEWVEQRLAMYDPNSYRI